MELAGKVALVTGASGNIGGAVARRLGENGAHAIVSYVGAKEAQCSLRPNERLVSRFQMTVFLRSYNSDCFQR